MYSQRWHGVVAIAFLVTCSMATPLAPQDVRRNASLNYDRLMMRDDTTEFDPTDLSFIKSMAAIGDSYSAGIGAGDRLEIDDRVCSRYDHAYPNLIHTDGRLGDPAKRTFQFKSCSGAVIADVIDKQIPNINGDQQVILLSAGGNDAELTNVLNQCVFQWATINGLQATLGWLKSLVETVTGKYSWGRMIDWDALSRGCEGQLDHTKQLIAGDTFSKSLDSVIAAAKAKLGPTGMIYYTGYAKFFAEDLSPACDSVSWSTWIYKSYNIFQPEAKLTRAHRKTMNELVDLVNARISDAVNRAGSQVKFVDYDYYVGYFGGRFCENGVDESTVASNTRTGLMFYELNTWDPLGLNPWKRSTNGLSEGTFEGYMNELAQITLEMDPDAKFTDQALMLDTDTSATVMSEMSISAQSLDFISNLLPDGYGRVFHPQILLHELIASRVIYEMSNQNEIDNNLPEIPEGFSFDSCPYYPPSSGPSSGQQIAVASYINPLGDIAAWNRLIKYPVDKVPILIANVVNGPDTAMDPFWADVIKRGSASGKTVLGYVRTGYLGVSNQKFLTRLGSGNLADWTAQIEEDIDMWYTLYPDHIKGIFFDEGWPECGDDNIYVNLYKHINDYTKRTHPGAYTVLNPGSPMASCFEDTMDTLLTFELDYAAYTNSYTPNDWVPKDPRKLWHIIYDVSESQIEEVVKLAKDRGAGIIQLTDDKLPNPYDNLPGESYMQSMMYAVEGGSLLNNEASPWPSGSSTGAVTGLKVLASDYSSAKLSWNAVSNALGYYVYSDDTIVTSVPSSMTTITLGGIKSKTSTYHVSAIGGGGRVGASSNTVTVTITSLPDGQTITNYISSPGMDSTIITADILVPYAFIRLYIWDSVGCEFDTNPGWTVNFKVDEYVCAHYMVEGTTLYKYSGILPEGSTAPPWSWSPVSPITLDITGYTYKWTLPLGTSTTDTSKFIVQAQGYNPLTNVFHPKADDYDCRGSSMCTTPDLLKWCDHAVNTLYRTDDPWYNTNTEGVPSQTGNCWGDQTRGCGVFLQGENCTISGNDMWNAYQNIRDIGGCSKCGTYHRADGCMVTINYVYACDNHSRMLGMGPGRIMANSTDATEARNISSI